MKKKKAIAAGLIVSLVCALVLTGCANGLFHQTLELNSDFSGSRVLEMQLDAAKYQDGKNDDGTIKWETQLPYYWLNTHGDELEAWLQAAIDADERTKGLGIVAEVDDQTVPTYLEDGVTPDDTKMKESGSEFIRLKFDFTDFNDYTNKLRAIAWFNGGLKQKSDAPEDAGKLTWHYVKADKGVDIVYYYEDPTLTFHLDTGKIYYNEEGVTGKFLYSSVWNAIVEDERTDENPDGIFERKGCNPEVPNYGNNGEDELYNAGVKVRNYYAVLGGEKYPINLKVQEQDDYNFNPVTIPLDKYDDFEVPAIDTANSEILVKNGAVDALTATVAFPEATADAESIEWFKAEVDGSEVIVGDKLGTGRTLSYTFDAAGEQAVVGVSGSVRVVKTLKAATYDYKITLAEAGKTDPLATFYINADGSITLPDLARAGYRYTLDSDKTSGFTTDTTITVTYVKTWKVTFKANDEVLSTVVVDDGKGVAEGDVPTAPAVEGKEFEKWDTAFDAVTGDITVTAVYKDVVKKSGCGAIFTVGGSAMGGGLMILALCCGIVLAAKRKKAVKTAENI